MLTDRDVEIITNVMRATVEPLEKRIDAMGKVQNSLVESVTELQGEVQAIKGEVQVMNKKIDDRSVDIIDLITNGMDETYKEQDKRFRIIEDRLGIPHKH